MGISELAISFSALLYRTLFCESPKSVYKSIEDYDHEHGSPISGAGARVRSVLRTHKSLSALFLCNHTEVQVTAESVIILRPEQQKDASKQSQRLATHASSSTHPMLRVQQSCTTHAFSTATHKMQFYFLSL